MRELQLHHAERQARTEEEGVTRLAPEILPVGNRIIFWVGRVHMAFKYGVVVVVVVVPQKRGGFRRDGDLNGSPFP